MSKNDNDKSMALLTLLILISSKVRIETKNRITGKSKVQENGKKTNLSSA